MSIQTDRATEIALPGDRATEIAREGEYVHMLYDRLDALRAQASERLAQALLEHESTQQARSQRDAVTARYAERIAQYDAVEHGLCFGRLDMHDGSRRYVGRLGIFDEDGEYEPLLLDWRAPAARPFYLATGAAPQGVDRRRQIRTEQRRVTGIDDEVLDLAQARRDAGDDHGLTSETALLAAIDANRTGRMRDIVETIQAEQDLVIRAPMDGVLVVQGGPGTGKTAVALHRAAYLLYTYREQLTRRGVLIVGPNATFLRYISEVLPTLAETGVLLGTVGSLFPGVRADGTDSPAAAEVKGRTVMVDVLARAVRDRQVVPDEPVEVRFDGDVVVLDRATVEPARERARRTGRPHNVARRVFVDAMLDALARQVADRVGADPYSGGNLLSPADIADIRAELFAERDVRTAIGRLWPMLTPQRLLADLYADPDRIASAAPQLTDAERALLHRSARGAWTPADVPLLDEAAELLGVDDSAARAAQARRRTREIAFAEGVLEIAAGSQSVDLEDEYLAEAEMVEVLTANDLMDAERFAERHEERDRRTAAERAAADRTWAFGHVIVDEAQELSPMAWRLLMRRCPSRSMTLVGDVAQTGDLAGTASWAQALRPYVADRWRLAELTVNYRTPAEIMAVAGTVLAAIDASMAVPRSVRTVGKRPWQLAVPPDRLAGELAAVVAGEAAAVGAGRLGVLTPAGRLAELTEAVRCAVPDAASGADPDLTSGVVVLTVHQAKGLEFDAVVVVDPAAILAESPRGERDLYVALTRATRRLGVLHPGGLPAPLRPADLDTRLPALDTVSAAAGS